MKNANKIKQLFLLIAMTVTTIAFSQGLKSEISLSKYRSQRVVDVVCQGPYTYLLYQGYAILRESWIVKTDSTGNILFELPFYLPNAESFENLTMVSFGQDLYISGRAFTSCDVNECFTFVTKMNALGIHQLQLNIDTEICFGGNKEPMNIGPSGEIIISVERLNDSKVYIYSSQGALIDTVIIPINNPTWVGLNSDGTLSYATVQSLHVLNSSGSASFNHTFTIPIREMVFEDSTYYATAIDTIFVLNDSLIIIDKIYFQGLSDFQKLKKFASEFQVLANMGPVRHVLTFDQNQVIRDLTLPIGVVYDPHIIDHSFSIYSIAISNNNIVSTTVRQLNYSLLNTNSISVSRPDIGIANQELLQHDVWPLIGTPDVYGLSAKLRVLVKNYSNYPVDSFKVNCTNLSFGVCTQFFVSERFHQFILPGDSAWVELPTIYFDYFYAPQGSSINKLICTSTSDPNGIADTNSYNNQYCEMSFLGFASVEEMEENSILLYPNPGNETLNVSHGLNGTLSYQVLNSQGQVVLKGSVQENAIDTGTMPSGLFFIQFFQDQKLMSTQKWMKL